MVGLKFTLLSLSVCLAYGNNNGEEKRILVTDPDSGLTQQMQRDIEQLKATVATLQSALGNVQSTGIGSTYIVWGRKDCPNNLTEIIYSGIAGGGYFNDPGRSAEPVCMPHDPQLGSVSSEAHYGRVFGMEYETNAFGTNLKEKDVPCALCRTPTTSSSIMIPGRTDCYTGWNREYSGNLMAGHYGYNGASNYICVHSSPDVLEGGAENQNGYQLFVVKAVCGALKCPPYVQNTLVQCVVCTK